MANSELIPCLPFDIALDCLLRVPLHCYSSLAKVCHSWRSLVSNPSFLHTRRSLGYTDHYACLIQALHAPSSGKTLVYGISIYDPKCLTWRRLPPIADLANGLPFFCQCAAVGCKLVLLGGWNPSSWAVLRSVYVYDLSTGLWRRGASMPSSRSFFACTAIDGNVVVAGGHDDNKNALRTAEMYNVENDEWETLPHMNEERDECKAVVMGGKLVVLSGFPTESQGQFGRSAEIYNTKEKAWNLVENLWVAGVAPNSAAVMKGQLYAHFETKLMRYRQKDGQWEPVAELPREVRAPACVTPLKESLFITGYNGGAQPFEAVNCFMGTPFYRWLKVKAGGASFSGIAQGACTLEL